jgi:hypothetical protein
VPPPPVGSLPFPPVGLPHVAAPAPLTAPVGLAPFSALPQSLPPLLGSVPAPWPSASPPFAVPALQPSALPSFPHAQPQPTASVGSAAAAPGFAPSAPFVPQ